MRRVVVTPTCAAGLGVVIAAVLAYPMTRTVISYGGRPPAGVAPCVGSGCGTGTQDGGGTPAAKPGKRLASPAPAAKHPQPSAPSATGGGASASGPQPVMHFQTLQRWPGGFVGQITITGPGVQASAHWQLGISYGSARIIGVWGGHWASRGDHAVLVTPDSGSGPADGGGDSVQVVLAVSGSPGPPTGCAFDGRACRIGQAGQFPEPDSSQTGSTGPQSPGPRDQPSR